MTVWEQVKGVLRSRKFWATVAALAAIWTAYYTAPTVMTLDKAIQATVAALAAYAVGTGLEGPRVPRA